VFGRIYENEKTTSEWKKGLSIKVPDRQTATEIQSVRIKKGSGM
jgi:hypothetical protein